MLLCQNPKCQEWKYAHAGANEEEENFAFKLMVIRRLLPARTGAEGDIRASLAGDWGPGPLETVMAVRPVPFR